MRLATAAKKAVSRGALVMITNADHASIRTLFRNVGNQHTVERVSILSGRSDHRRLTSELVVTSY